MFRGAIAGDGSQHGPSGRHVEVGKRDVGKVRPTEHPPLEALHASIGQSRVETRRDQESG
jgi:hypothetical protein